MSIHAKLSVFTPNICMCRLKMVGTEVTPVSAGDEVGTSMERTMYPGSGLSVEITPLILPECIMHQ